MYRFQRKPFSKDTGQVLMIREVLMRSCINQASDCSDQGLTALVVTIGKEDTISLTWLSL